MSLYDLDGGMGAAREVDRKPLRAGESVLSTVTAVHQDQKHIFVRMGTGGVPIPLSPGSVPPPVGSDVLLVGTRQGPVAVYFPAAREIAWNYVIAGVGGVQVQPDALLGVRCRITGWQLEADVAGDAVVEIRRNSRTGAAITGTGAQRPFLTADDFNEGTTGNEWTPVVELWDRLYFVVISSATISKLSIALKAVRF